MSFIRILLTAFLSLSVFAFLPGCSVAPTTEQPVQEIVYPQPPEQPRFYYEYTLTSSSQVKGNLENIRFRQMLTGEVESGEGLSKPFDITVCQGVLYVSDTVSRSVHAFDFPGKRYFTVGDREEGSLEKPLGLATDGQCNLYISDGSQSRIVIYDAEGNFIRAVGGKKWFQKLSHVTVDPDGTRIYAVDTGGVSSDNHLVRVFDSNSGERLYDIGTRGSKPGEFNLPRDIEYYDGKLYVADGGNFRVQVLTVEGEFIREFGEIGDRWGQFSRPKGIALDGEGNIYVSDAGFGNFQIFNPEGKLLLVIGDRSNTSKPGGYMLPAGIDIDEDGRIYFVGQFYRKIDIFRPAALNRDQGFFAGHKTAIIE